MRADSRISRKVFLGVLAVVVSFGLTGASAYVLYCLSGSSSEAQLSALARFVVSPLIAAITGALVGIFSTDRPIYLTIVGLAPWALTFLASATRPNARDLIMQTALLVLYVGIGPFLLNSPGDFARNRFEAPTYANPKPPHLPRLLRQNPRRHHARCTLHSC